MGAGRKVRILADGYCLRETGRDEPGGVRRIGRDDEPVGTGRACAVCVGRGGVLRKTVSCGAWGADSETGNGGNV